MLKRIRNFFFPPAGSSFKRRALPLAILFGVPFVCAVSAIPTWEYTNSPSFCGTTCHTMPPEYQTYQVSPHARVPCVDCHIGRGSFFTQIYRKTGHMKLLFDTVTGNYEFPIRTETMRPARDTCELCHFPEKFSDDSLRVNEHFTGGEESRPYSVYLLMHTGGGSQREGLSRGIHWHIENEIEYIATGEFEQEIPWVQVKEDGKTTVYVSVDSTIDENNLDQYTPREMDCISCHNRIAHLIPNPTGEIDTALYQGDLSPDIPYIRERAIELLSKTYDSSGEAKEAFETLDSYYQENYPDFYAENQDKIAGAIQLLIRLHGEIQYPEQELDWTTHPNNIGHRSAPGCFRCHDGKHFSSDGEMIRLECNLCHSIPLVVKPGDVEPQMALATGLEPTNHLLTTWISQHSVEYDNTCANCHTTTEPGGVSDVSFCSNSVCHGVDWQYADFEASLKMVSQLEDEDAIAIQEDRALSYQTIQPILEERCARCHDEKATRGLNVTDYQSLMAGSEDGPVIVPGSVDESLIIQTLQAGHFGQLTDGEMELLKQWIEAGAPEE
ncbi:MAG TPA: NapC/NirT family cytochrome c [Aggregatilineaceae bacterium]|nr:NapC/NirT family cytochrome c [Aggregatilineaceae bacterium]